MQRLLNYRNDVLLMRAAGKLRNYTTILLVHLLCSDNVAEHPIVAQNGCRRFVAARFNGE
jgi:hypothetical protein